MNMIINLESPKFGTHINFSVHMKLPVSFFHIICHQLSTAVNNCQQLITVDENEVQPRELKFSININFSVHMKISVNFLSYRPSSAVNSW